MDDLVNGVAIHYPHGKTGIIFADAAPLIGAEVSEDDSSLRPDPCFRERSTTSASGSTSRLMSVATYPSAARARSSLRSSVVSSHDRRDRHV